MDNEVDIDQLIKKDREEKKKRTHPIQKAPRNQERFPQNRNRDYDREQNWNQRRSDRDREEYRRDNRDRDGRDRNFQDNRQQGLERSESQERPMPQRRNQFKGYALLVKGFVSDVSINDIYNLLRGRKISNIKTILSGTQNEPIDVKKHPEMDVYITFLQKEEADSFIAEYGDKLLDGKHSLNFQYRRAF